MHRIMLAMLVTCVAAELSAATAGALDPAASQAEDEAVVESTDSGEEMEEEISIDAEGSLWVPPIFQGQTGWSIIGDARGLGAASDVDNRDGESEQDTDLNFRLRAGLKGAFTESLRAGFRLAASCSSESCQPDAFLDEATSGSTDSQLDVDEAFVHWFRNDRFDLAVGRLQTRFITKGGVFAKSLDRNDSPNTRITWTDGAHGTVHHLNGWVSHLILQHNPEDGPAQILRDPLDFSSSESRTSVFFSLVNEEPYRFLTQRGIDISYYPSALKKDGLVEDSRIEDYWGFVARFAGRYPARPTGTRIRFSAEMGYAPNTPTNDGVDLPGSGDTDGIAVAITVSLMDFLPRHSLGLNYAHTEAGWLLSPQYNKNQQLLELRYVWVATKDLTVDARIRRQEDLDQFTDAVQRRSELDAFVRLTWKFRRDSSFGQ
jgi:hypothetical protein